MFIENLKNELNTSVTENGAVGYKTTGKELLDFNFKVSSYRSMSENQIKKDFMKAFVEDKEIALKYLFYVRDVRGGLGERRLFRVCIQEIMEYLDERVFDWIAEYGRYDDLFVFFGTKLEAEMLHYVEIQLRNDMAKTLNNEPISLLAKWMPSVNASAKTKKMARKFIKAWGISDSEYRKMLSQLRKHLDVTERKTCANNWTEIDYQKVSSQANLKYNSAFLRHDEERRRAFLDSLSKGEAKINSSTLFPHDVVYKYRNGSYSLGKFDQALESMWEGLPDFVKGDSKILVVRDGSGSMTSRVGNTNIQALDVSTALAIYFSEKQEGQFKDKFITFSSQPELVDLSNCKNLREKLKIAYGYDDCSNTDIEATFDLVLQTAINNHLSQEEIPNLLIISDMEFDQARGYESAWRSYDRRPQNKLFELISNKFKTAGYEMPKLIFWNVNSRTGTIPVKENENGLILVSGFSPAVAKMVLSNELDPYKALLKELMSPRYERVSFHYEG